MVFSIVRALGTVADKTPRSGTNPPASAPTPVSLMVAMQTDRGRRSLARAGALKFGGAAKA